jgi:hypothetical protein
MIKQTSKLIGSAYRRHVNASIPDTLIITIQ